MLAVQLTQHGDILNQIIISDLYALILNQLSS